MTCTDAITAIPSFHSVDYSLPSECKYISQSNYHFHTGSRVSVCGWFDTDDLKEITSIVAVWRIKSKH
jgi:pectate lyase